MQFATISESKRHDVCAVWSHITPKLDFIKATTNADVLHIRSDGSTSQYRNKTNSFCSNYSCKT